MSKKTGLGKGLSALIPDSLSDQETSLISQNKGEKDTLTAFGSELRQVPLADIERNPYQPRTVFDDDKLSELTSSIQEVGVLQPILLRELNGRYELVAGERRWRALKKAKKRTAPAYIINVKSESDFIEMALIENIQREDLNPIEEAEAYALLNTKYNMAHEPIAKAVGKKRVTISNALRLLKLPSEIIKSLKLI